MRLRNPSHLAFISPLDTCPDLAVWKLFPLNQNYEVSEYGHLRRSVSGSNSKKGRIIRPSQERAGYVKYETSFNNVASYWRAHRLVALTFIENPSGLPMVLHNDGSKLNCHFSNLRWSTAKENTEDSRKHGTLAIGERSGKSNLKTEDIIAIRASTTPQRRLAKEFGVTQAAIHRIRKGLSWKHLRQGDVA